MTTTVDAVVDCIWQANASLGEGPLWDAADGVLHWIDITAGRLHRLDLAVGKQATVNVGEKIGCIALRDGGGLVAGLRSGFAFLDSLTGAIAPINDPESALPTNRFNDGAVDPLGNFWAGTMDDDETAPSGNLYRLEPSGAVSLMRSGFVIGNGIDWSPDGTTMYFTDSTRRRIIAYDFDTTSAEISGDRDFAWLGEDDGFPDGLTVDAEGGVWSAVWDGHRLLRFSPDGELERTVAMPVPRPTSMAFGGEGLSTLFVTSARIGLDPAALDAAPLSGGVFAIDVGVRGLPARTYLG